MKIDDLGAAGAPPQRTRKGEREDERWLGDLERAWLANWMQSAEVQGAPASKAEPPASQAGVASSGESRRPAGHDESMPNRPSGEPRHRSPHADRPTSVRPEVDRLEPRAVTERMNSLPARSGTSAMQGSASEAVVEPKLQATNAGGPGQGSDATPGDVVRPGHGAQATVGQASVALPGAVLQTFDAGLPTPQAVMPAFSASQAGPGQAHVGQVSEGKVGEALPPTQRLVAARVPGAVAAFPQQQRLPAAAESHAEETPGASGQPPSTSGRLPDKTSLQVTTQEDSAVVTLRDAALADPHQQAQVSRMLALQMQQLGFHSIRTYVNGVMRQTGPERTDGPAGELQQEFSAQQPVQRTFISGIKESR
jgi:hypothetical protein